MAHAIFQPNAIAALNIDAFYRSAKSAVDVDNGNIVKLTTKSAEADETEVWTAIAPSTSDGLTGLWMVHQPELVLTPNGSGGFYAGLNPDVRNFYNLAGSIFRVFKPQVGDILEFSADAFGGTYIAGTTTHVNATDGGGLKPVWGNSQTASVFSMKLLVARYFSLATGAIDSQRITSYQFEVVGL